MPAIRADSSSVRPREIDSAIAWVNALVRKVGAPSLRRHRLERLPVGCVAVAGIARELAILPFESNQSVTESTLER